MQIFWIMQQDKLVCIPMAEIFIYYCWFVLGEGLLPDIQARCRQHKWTFQQDGAPAQTARYTADYLKNENIDFIEPGMSLQNSADLIAVDYAVGGGASATSLQRTKI